MGDDFSYIDDLRKCLKEANDQVADERARRERAEAHAERAWREAGNVMHEHVMREAKRAAFAEYRAKLWKRAAKAYRTAWLRWMPEALQTGAILHEAIAQRDAAEERARVAEASLSLSRWWSRQWKARAKEMTLFGRSTERELIESAEEEVTALRAIVAKLPRCWRCERPATRCYPPHDDLTCDDCDTGYRGSEIACDLPYAPEVRAYEAVRRQGGNEGGGE